MNDSYERLFPTPQDFNEADYLTFLAQRVPQDLIEQLSRDAHPDLMLDEYVEVTDLIQPLSSRSFPAGGDSCSIPIHRLAWVLEYTLTGYALAISQSTKSHDPYKQIYIASFYLHCSLHEVVGSRGYVSALFVLVKAAAEVTLEGQLQVSRFIASLIPMTPAARVLDPTPMSTALIALSLIVLNIASDLSLLAVRAMDKEHFPQAWAKEEEDFREGGYPCLDAMKILRRTGAAFFAVSGKIEEIADRFRKAEDWTRP